MDSHSDGREHESRAKRLKLDSGEPSFGAQCSRDASPKFSGAVDGHLDCLEGNFSENMFRENF